MPSSTVKTAPHFGHLIFASFETFAHPSENTANNANAKKILTHFLINLHLLSLFFRKIAEDNIVPKIDNKNPFSCQVKNKGFLKIRIWQRSVAISAFYFFFGLAFFVAFFALGCFIPHDIFRHLRQAFILLIYLLLLN